MLVVASFDYCIHTELAISELVEKGVDKEHVLAVPLEVRGETRELLDSIHHSDGVSMIDGGFLVGTTCMTMGVIYGFNLDWGPIIWGLIALLGGVMVGCLFDYLLGSKRHSRNRSRGASGPLVFLIECRADQTEIVKKVLWGHKALGVSTVAVGE
ncbi:MAG: hypothetical protein ABRQ26_06280 [Syntrophomonadaceae bacterium]